MFHLQTPFKNKIHIIQKSKKFQLNKNQNDDKIQAFAHCCLLCACCACQCHALVVRVNAFDGLLGEQCKIVGFKATFTTETLKHC